MASRTTLTALLLVSLLWNGAVQDSGGSQTRRRSVYAAVFLNSGSGAVGTTNDIGLFKRGVGETAWRSIYRPNLFIFGLGWWQRGSTQRFYIAAGNGLHRSSDGGRSWRILTSWETAEALSVALDPIDSSLIYIAMPFGIFKSTDDGAHWVKSISGMKKWFVRRVVIGENDRRTLYAAAEDDLYRTTDGGESWRGLHVGVPGILSVLALNSDTLLAGTEDHGVRVSLNGGKSWQGGEAIPQTAIYVLQKSPDGKLVYAAGFMSGLWKSVDSGVSWSLLWGAPNVEAIYAMAVDPRESDHLLVGTNGQGVYESCDGGTSWSSAGLEGAHVTHIEMEPEDGSPWKNQNP